MTSCIGVYSHENIVFVWTYLDCSIDIGTLEASIKDNTVSGFESRVHSFEWSTMLRLEMRIKLSEICCQVRKVGIDDGLILIIVLSSHLLMHFEATRIPRTYLSSLVPRYTTLYVCFLPN
jgi:hypothetical protein